MSLQYDTPRASRAPTIILRPTAIVGPRTTTVEHSHLQFVVFLPPTARSAVILSATRPARRLLYLADWANNWETSTAPDPSSSYAASTPPPASRYSSPSLRRRRC